MKTLSFLAALPVALLVLLILRRGRSAPRRILRSPILLNTVRIVAVLAAIGGFAADSGAQDGGNAPDPATSRPQPADPPLARSQVNRWHAQLRDPAIQDLRRLIFATYLGKTAADDDRSSHLLARLPERLRQLVAEDLAAEGTRGMTPAPLIKAETMLEALAEIEENALWFPVVNAVVQHLLGRLERRTATTEQRLKIAAGAARVEGLTEALVLAMARTGPITIGPRAWASKAGSGRQIAAAEARAIAGIHRDLNEILQQTGSPGRSRERETSFWVDSGRLALSRNGTRPDTLVKGGVFRFGRHDLLLAENDATLRHIWLGAIDIKAKDIVDDYGLPDHLNEIQRATIRDAIDKAFTGDLVALGLVELSLPLCHRELARAMRSEQQGPGRDALLMILRSHDLLQPREIVDFKLERRDQPLDDSGGDER